MDGNRFFPHANFAPVSGVLSITVLSVKLRSLFAEGKDRKSRRRIRHEATDIRIGVASSVQRGRRPVSLGCILVARQPNQGIVQTSVFVTAPVCCRTKAM